MIVFINWSIVELNMGMLWCVMFGRYEESNADGEAAERYLANSTPLIECPNDCGWAMVGLALFGFGSASLPLVVVCFEPSKKNIQLA